MEQTLKALAEQLEKKQITPETYAKTVANLMQSTQPAVEKEVIDVNDDIPIKPVEKVKAVRAKSFENVTETYKIDMSKFEGKDMQAHFDKIRPIILKKLTKIIENGNPMKFYLEYKAKFLKQIKDIIVDGYFTTSPLIATKGSNKKEQIDELLEDIDGQVAAWIQAGSDLTFESSTIMYVQLAKWKPLKGGSYIPSPEWVKNNKSCVNVRNTDDQCFKWAILSALHPTDRNKERLSNYTPFEENYNWDGIEFPTALEECARFEKNNPGISINVYEIGDSKAKTKPVYVADKELAKHIYLGLIEDQGKKHYVWIPSFSRFQGMTSKNNHKKFYCPRCLHGFTEQRMLDEHQPDCGLHYATKVKMLKEGENEIRFKKISAQLKSPFVVYADFECIIDKDGKHIPCGYSYLLVSEYPHFEIDSRFWKLKMASYTGKDCMVHFFKAMNQVEYFVYHILEINKPMNLTEKEQESFQKAKHCYLCNEDFKTKSGKHKDHDHLTGAYRGAACPGCNLNFNYKDWKLPVIFHNLQGYDSHVILNAMSCAKKPSSMRCIAHNMEKYLEFEIYRLKFIDSLQFMNSSLAKLVENLAKEGKQGFKHTKKHWKDNTKVDLVTRKGVYPYEYMDSFKKFDKTELPPIEAFYSSLTKSGIEPEEYEYAQKIWKAFNCKTLKDYHDLYLQTDVLLLADVFENFRNVCNDAFGLDPPHFVSAPHLAWNAMLKYTKIKLESLTDINMHLMVEKGIRGGICMVSKRHAKANNKYMKEFDMKQTSSYITYLDANNLYGWAMVQTLPKGGYEWVEKKWNAQKVLNYDVDSKHGYILEVDLDYPKKLHDLHNDYPLAPESTCYQPSPFMKDLMDELNTKQSKVNKLIPNLCNKKKYVLHIRTLKQYLEMGLILKKVHRTIRFKQSKWLKPYIDFNTEKRKQSKSDFEKDFWKLMNNAVFGKFMENVRNHVDIQLVTTEENAQKLINKPTYKRKKEFSKDLIGIEMMKKETKLNKPIPIGLSILDISKTLMYDFHYKHIKKEYGEKAKLCYTDTDSLIYHIETEDMYEDFKKHRDKFDFSEYPLDHPNHDKTNGKVIGKMKDEVKGKIIQEFVGLRPKMYSVWIGNPGDGVKEFIKKAKGVKAPCMKEITHNDYKRCLFGERKDRIQSSEPFHYIKSRSHKLETAECKTKITLSCIEDKRFYVDMVSSYAHGHHLNELQRIHQQASAILQGNLRKQIK